MKQRITSLLFLVAFFTHIAVAQNDQNIKFDVLTEDGNFFNELMNSDIQIKGAKDLSLKLKSDNSLEILIMIDTSASQERMIPFEKKAAQTFINDFLKNGKDKVSIVSFSGKVTLEQDLTNDLKKVVKQIETIEFVPPTGYIGGGVMVSNSPPKNDQQLAGSTSIWDSTKQILDAFSKLPNNANTQRAVIIISDGVNTYGEAKIKEVTAQSFKANIPIYAIGIGDDFYDGVDKKSLKKITEETGGIAVFPKKKLEDITQILKTLEQSLRSSYELNFTFNALNSKNKLREIEIEIINPALRKRKLQIIQPRGFIVP